MNERPDLNPIALPGDVVLCPGCHAELAEFTTPNFTGARFLSASRRRHVGGGEGELWCQCGEGACRPNAPTGRRTGAAEVPHLGPRLFVRSGAWTGWRAIGGE